MCGIYAAFQALPQDPADWQLRLDTVSKQLEHRGPDAGAWKWADERHVLLHRRLSIVGLGPAGDQPMSDGRFLLTYNGEIYNYIELAEQEGWTLESGTDTELLLRLWAAYGPDCLGRLDGFFAFVILDQEQKQAWAVRDFSGVKPLYFTGDGHSQLALCSEEAPLASHARVHSAAIRAFFNDGLSDLLPWIEGLQEIPPGHLLPIRWTETALRVEEPVKWYTSEKMAIKDLKSHLLASMKRRLRSDVPIAFALSGGLDSAVLLGLAREALGPEADLHAFSVGSPGMPGDESEWQEQVAEFNKVNWHRIDLNQAQAKWLPEYVATTGRPAVAWNNLAHWALCKEVKAQGMVVLFNGQGADELFGGYPHYYRAALLREPWALIKQVSKWPISPPRLLLQALLSWVKQSELTGKSPAMLMREDFFGLRLGQLLHYEDRNGMAFSLESRNPFADDHILADWALGQGEELSSRLHNGYSKGALRQAAKGLVPQALLERTDKKGFTVPETALTLRCLEEWKEAIFHERLNAHVSQEMRKKAWKRLVKNANDQRSARYLFRCASLSYYLKFVASRHEPSQPH
ncbi:MAG: hypothetical protein RL577_417 [Bacteroidota bacterium]